MSTQGTHLAQGLHDYSDEQARADPFRGLFSLLEVAHCGELRRRRLSVSPHLAVPQTFRLLSQLMLEI